MHCVKIKLLTALQQVLTFGLTAFLFLAIPAMPGRRILQTPRSGQSRSSDVVLGVPTNVLQFDDSRYVFAGKFLTLQLHRYRSRPATFLLMQRERT